MVLYAYVLIDMLEDELLLCKAILSHPTSSFSLSSTSDFAEWYRLYD
jgi:hypothetical protein